MERGLERDAPNTFFAGECGETDLAYKKSQTLVRAGQTSLGICS